MQSNEEAINTLLKEDYAYLGDSVPMAYELGRIYCIVDCSIVDLQELYTSSGEAGYHCDVTESGPTIFPGYYVMTWKKDFEYGPILNY